MESLRKRRGTELPIAHPERLIALGYAPAPARRLLTTLFALDERLAEVVARTSEPTIGLLRLIWWRDALAALDVAPPAAEPLLIAAAGIVAAGHLGQTLADMVAGWEALIDDPSLGDATLATHAEARGAGLFALAAAILSASPAEQARLARAGAGWARVDLARQTRDRVQAAAILASARAPLAKAMAAPWPRHLRPLAQLAVLAFDDVHRGADRLRPAAAPARLLRILRFQISGR